MDIGTKVRILDHPEIEAAYRGETGAVEIRHPRQRFNNIVKFDHPERTGYTVMPFEDDELEIIE